MGHTNVEATSLVHVAPELDINKVFPIVFYMINPSCRLVYAFLFVLFILFSDSYQPSFQSVEPKFTSQIFKAEKAVRGLDYPVGIAFLDKDDFLIIEKNTGEVKRSTNGTLLDQAILDFNVANDNERGLVGIAISKNNSENKTYVFLYLTESRSMDGEDECIDFHCDPQHNYIGNRLYRYEFKDNALINPKLLLDIPPTLDSMHVGGKIVIGKDNNLYIGIGDLNNDDQITTNTINGSSPNGSAGIIRLTQNGSKVTPVIFGDEYPYYLYYAYGIRNVFGLGFDPLTGNLWDTENGPGYGDEINLVFPGFNGGWKVVSGNREATSYTGGNLNLDPVNLTTLNGIGEYSLPELTLDRFTVGPTSLVFLNSTQYGNDYKNDMFVSVIKPNGNLYHFDLANNNNRTELALDKTIGLENKNVLHPDDLEPYLFGKSFGGIADLEVSPDGYVYVVSFFQDTVFKIVKQDQ